MPRLTISAVRGAISVSANTSPAIREATSRLLLELLRRNRLTAARIVSALFTSTPDLTADFPAHAARRLGWHDVPLLGATEVRVPGAPARIVRVLLTVRDVPAGATLEPVYLDRAATLRPDLTDSGAGASADAVPKGRTLPRIAIIGLGQIGGSAGLALAGRWHRTGFDTSAAVRRAAARAGAIDAAAPTLEAACANADLALVAVPVDALPGVIAHVAAALPRGAALLDTGSARVGVTQTLRAAARRGVHACGGHPLCGREGRGLAAADGTLFAGAPFLLLPLAVRVPARVRAFVRDLGARPRVVSPAAHDAALARTSHLPYVLACALARVGGGAAARGLSGPGYAGMTRLAASDPRMAGAYVRANRANVERAWRALRREVVRELRARGPRSAT